MSGENRVVPAVLTDSPATLISMVRQAEAFTHRIQIDIMDGRFVPSHSVENKDILGVGVKIEWEAHLMVNDPEKYVKQYRVAGAKRIIVHYESMLNDTVDVIENIKSLGLEAGLAINPETSIKILTDNLVSRLDSVLFMAVHPGYYGAMFIPGVLDKIQSFRRVCPDVSIGIDGGIKPDNIRQVASTGVNEICVGSAIFKQPDAASAYYNLLKLAREGWASNQGH